MSKFIVKTVTYCLVEAESIDFARGFVHGKMPTPQNMDFLQIQEGVIQKDDVNDLEEWYESLDGV